MAEGEVPVVEVSALSYPRALKRRSRAARVMEEFVEKV
jgi:hypothetical protein